MDFPGVKENTIPLNKLKNVFGLLCGMCHFKTILLSFDDILFIGSLIKKL